MLASGMGNHWELSEGEAKGLEKGLKQALRHHDMQVQQKYVDYAFCAFVVGKIYAPRVISTLNGKSDAQPEQHQVIQFPTVG